MKLLDLTGQQFERLVVVERAHNQKRGKGPSRVYWLCRCTCARDTLKEVEASALRSGVTKSCGCLQQENARKGTRVEAIDLTGQQFGRLIVVKRAPSRKGPNGKSRSFWLCRCACDRGILKEIETAALRSGSRKSCGCLHLECRPMLDRLLEKLAYDHGCWTWTASTTMEGYAIISEEGRDGKRHYAHRVMYELENGKIPSGLEIDHLCRNRACCNPLHLEAVTRAVNVARGKAPEIMKEKAKSKTHCLHGHPLFGDNLYVRPNGDRCCRTCNAARGRKRYAARIEALRVLQATAKAS